MSQSTAIRPLWPDELPRLAQAFPDLRIAQTCRPLVLVATEPYERLVGAALVVPPPANDTQHPCELQWQIRPRFADRATELLKAATASLQAGETLVWQERTAEGQNASPAPAAAGFVCAQTHEVWGIPLGTEQTRRCAMSDSIRQRAANAGFAVETPGATHQEEIVALTTTAGLLTGARVRFRDEHPSGYDRELSAVVTRDGAVVGTILIRREHMRAVIETRVVAPEQKHSANFPNALLLDHALRAAESAGLTDAILTADPASAPETIRFAKKCGGNRQATLRLWRFGP